MENGLFCIVSMLQEKLVLYHSLIDVLEQEKKSLIASDVETLWQFSDQKQKYVREIEALRTRMLAELDHMGVDHGMNALTFRVERMFAFLPNQRDRLMENLQRALLTAKTKVHALSRANKNFVEEYLSVLDEMIAIITSAGRNAVPYERPRVPGRQERANLLLHREV